LVVLSALRQPGAILTKIAKALGVETEQQLSKTRSKWDAAASAPPLSIGVCRSLVERNEID
jgi:transposase-like protein